MCKYPHRTYGQYTFYKLPTFRWGSASAISHMSPTGLSNSKPYPFLASTSSTMPYSFASSAVIQ